MTSRSRRRAREDGPEDLGDHSAAISALRAQLDRLEQQPPPKVPVFSGVMGGLAAVVALVALVVRLCHDALKPDGQLWMGGGEVDLKMRVEVAELASKWQSAGRPLEFADVTE